MIDDFILHQKSVDVDIKYVVGLQFSLFKQTIQIYLKLIRNYKLIR